MCVSVLIGILMMHKHQLRQIFNEDLKSPSEADIKWSPPLLEKPFKHKTLIALHQYNPPAPETFIFEKTSLLNKENKGIHTLILSGTPKVPTNAYLRILAQENWGIEEIRVHGTTCINIYALLNLIKANPDLKRILIWDNKWKLLELEKIKSILKESNTLTLYK